MSFTTVYIRAHRQTLCYFTTCPDLVVCATRKQKCSQYQIINLTIEIILNQNILNLTIYMHGIIYYYMLTK